MTIDIPTTRRLLRVRQSAEHRAQWADVWGAALLDELEAARMENARLRRAVEYVAQVDGGTARDDYDALVQRTAQLAAARQTIVGLRAELLAAVRP